MLFVLLVFALLGIAALCVDIGFASLSQSQMQTAADTAALEGVRLRDYHEYHLFGAPYRRGRVSELVRQVFDDDMHPTQGVAPTTIESPIPGAPPPPGPMPADDRDELMLGAGPIYRLSDGLGSANASALLTAPQGGAMTTDERWVDDPRLQENTLNRPNGDMLTGAYNPFASHAEGDDYTRPDFTPAVTSPLPPSWDAISFLVRMRRTTGSNASDDTSGVSSRGAALPLLFGMGSMIQSNDGSGYDPRRDGLTVRATAVAVGRAPLTIGPPLVLDSGAPMLDRIGNPIRGVGYWYYPSGTVSPTERRHVVVAWAESFWNSITFHTLVPEAPQTLTVRLDGSIEFRPNSSVVEIVGQLLVAPCDFATLSDECPGTVGTTLGMSVEQDLSQAPYLFTQADLDAIVGAAGSVSNTRRCYMPIYSAITAPNGTTTKRIIAFCYGLFSADEDGQPTVYKGWDGSADISSPLIVAPDNTSSKLSPRAPALSASEWGQIFDKNQQFVYPSGNATYDWHNVRPGTVLTPVLAR